MQPVWVVRRSETHTEEEQKAVHNTVVFTEIALGGIVGMSSQLCF